MCYYFKNLFKTIYINCSGISLKKSHVLVTFKKMSIEKHKVVAEINEKSQSSKVTEMIQGGCF